MLQELSMVEQRYKAVLTGTEPRHVLVRVGERVLVCRGTLPGASLPRRVDRRNVGTCFSTPAYPDAGHV